MRWDTNPDVSPYLHVPSICGTRTLPSLLASQTRWKVRSVFLACTNIKLLLLSTEEQLRDKLPGSEQPSVRKHNFLWKTLHLQRPLASNHVGKKINKQNEQNLNIFPLKSSSVGCRKAEIQVVGQTTRKLHLVSALWWLRTDKGFSRLLIRLWIFFFLHAVKDERADV